MRADGRECQPWCGTDYPAPPEAVVINGNVFQYGPKVYCCPEKAFAAASLYWERLTTPRGFYGAGIGNLLAGEQKKLDFKADAERLAELREEYDTLRLPVVELGILPSRKVSGRIISLQAIIAVYEECAARGLTFGGGR